MNTIENMNTIEKIKAIIQEYGSFTTAEVEAESSPFYGSLGKFLGLIENFGAEHCEVVVYKSGDSEELDMFQVPYEDFLEKETLEEILELCERWKEICNEN